MSSNSVDDFEPGRRHTVYCFRRSASKIPYRCFRGALVILLCLAGMLHSGCELVPSRPEAVFIVYRDRMKSGNVSEARKFLTEESRKLALAIGTQYKLELPAEDFAFLNILDPQNNPVATVSEDKFALLQVRTIRGGVRMIRLIRENTSSPWKINIVEELKALEGFLEAQAALEMMRDKAGEYAASWKAFSDQLDRMTVSEEPAEKSLRPKQPKKPKSRASDRDRKGNLAD